MLRIAVVAAVALAAGLPAAASAATVHFTSPTGNIDCRSDAANDVSCFVEKGHWSNERPRPANCEWDWEPRQVSLTGNKIVVGACRGDIGPLCVPASAGGDDCTVLRYGRSVRIGKIRCSSAAAGITCRANDGKGRGWRVSRTELKTFS